VKLLFLKIVMRRRLFPPQNLRLTVGCRLENHIRGAVLRIRKKAVRERLITGVVRINIQTTIDLLTTWLWHVRW
jgi:hypothetical protein